MAVTLHIGTYDKSGGRGLVPLTLGDRGSLNAGEPYPHARNASFGVCEGDLAYLVDEQDDGALTVHRRDGHGWKLLSRVPTGGGAPCYLALDRENQRLAVANYESGSAALFALDEDGLPRMPPAMFQNEGNGPNEERQDGPHAHCVRFADDGGLYLVDLGADQVLRFTLSRSGFGEASVAFTGAVGSGPRHLLLHPSEPYAVLLSELAASLTLAGLGPLGLEARQIVPTAPEDFADENLGGHLELNAAGTRVYVSNRGHNSIAVFALENGRLDLLQRIPSGGNHPRHFALLEGAGWLVAAHEKDGRVTVFGLNVDGTLSPTNSGIVVPGACFVLVGRRVIPR